MSCFIVSDEHIRVLVHAASRPEDLDVAHMTTQQAIESSVRYRTPNGEEQWVSKHNAAEIGEMLMGFNVRAFNHSYGRNEEHTYTHRAPRHTKWSPFEIISAAQGYRYQASEAPGWEGSEAERFINTLIDRMVSLTPQLRDANVWAIGDDTMPQTVAAASL